MKKILFVMPLMAISLLASCNNGGGDNPPEPEQDEWYEDTTYINSLTPADVTKENPDGSVGVIQTIKVNGLDHKVRLIGVEQDVDSKGNKIHTTWEFVDLLSDERGYSLATYWNDTRNQEGSNYSYKDSTIRKALNNTTNNINWFRFYGISGDDDEDPRNYEFATEARYKKSVLNMLPTDLVPVLKAPSKYINIWNDEKYPEAGWEEQTIEDKLFLLTPVEMGKTDHEYEEESTTPYAYYDGAEDNDRIKHQIKWYDGARTGPLSFVDSGESPEDKYSYAGFNSSVSSHGGEPWLRSPDKNTSYFYCAWNVDEDGYLNNALANRYAKSIAPAFCI